MCIIYDYMCITTLCKCALNTKLLRISLFVYESMSISVRCIVFVILFCDTVLGCVPQFFYFLYLHIHTKANKLFLLVFIKTNFFCLVSCVYVCICLCCPLCICAYLRVAPCLLFVSVHFFVSVHICALHYFMTLFFDTVLWYCFGVYRSFVIVFCFSLFFPPVFLRAYRTCHFVCVQFSSRSDFVHELHCIFTCTYLCKFLLVCCKCVLIV